MSGLGIAAAVVGGLAVLATAGSAYGAKKLFNSTIPRQKEVKVDTSEMADAGKWEEYKVIIHERKDWLLAREMEHITIKSRDDLTLHGDYIPADNESDTIAMCFHGYTGAGMKDCVSVAAFFVKQGFDCLVVDNRSHGQSEGEYIGFGILDRYDCLSWIKYINERFGGKKKIVLYGVSMGAATVVMTAGFPELPDNVKAIISDCAFTSPYDVFAHILKRDYHMAEFPVMNINNAMSRKKAGYGFSDYSTLTAVKNTKCPILFIHGKEDTFVPTRMSEENYAACVSPKELLLVDNAGHAASYYENVPLYEKTVLEFLEKHMK